jgi:two-component system, OmpR family, sensor kinase
MRLTASYAGVLSLFLASLGAAYYHAFARQLDADATDELGELTRAVHGYLRFQAGMPVLVYAPDDPDQVAFIQEATRFYQVYDGRSGALLVQSPALEPLGLHYTPGEVHSFVSHPRTFDVQTDHGKIRFSNGLISPRSDETYLVQVGVSLDQRDAALRRFMTLLIWSLPAGLLAVVIGGWWMAGRALAPLADLASATRGIGVQDLRRRLPVRGVGDERDAIADAFNAVVARLERAVLDTRMFAAAMAHELRTPLAALRGEIELSLTATGLSDAHRTRMASQLEEIDRLTRLVNQLLVLARAEAGEISLAGEAVDLASLALSTVEAIEPLAQARDISLTCNCAGDATITGDRGWMERLLLNVIDNAIKFTAAGGTVSVSVIREGDIAKLTVRDTGVGIPPDDVPHVFERFYRGDSARSSQTEGAGLGLSLVRWIAEQHGAKVGVASQPEHGSTFTFSFPIRMSRSGASDRPRTPAARRAAA